MYRDASRVLDRVLKQGGGLKTMALSSQVKNKGKTYAVVCETLKYKATIDQVLEAAGLSKSDLARNEGLLYVMLYDHLFGKGVQGGGAVKRAIKEHAEKLKTALERVMKAEKADSHEDLLAEQVKNAPKMPRFARVNLAKTTVEETMKNLSRKLPTPAIDKHIPYVLQFPPKTDLHDDKLVQSGDLILQDKSSCFPAHILRQAMEGEDLDNIDAIDATAAPGNKTSQLASLGFRKVIAFDKDKNRHDLLRRRMQQAGVLDTKVSTHCADFLDTRPEDPRFKDVRVILLDPSCSGSGMIGRVDHLVQGSAEESEAGGSSARLERLAKFQQECLRHAMSFPQVKYISYSTCSVHDQENEQVVATALNENPTFSLQRALPSWDRRGRNTCGLTKKQAKCLVRVDPTQDRTCGFFVALFVRNADDTNVDRGDGEKTPSTCSSEKKRAKRKARKTRLREQQKKTKENPQVDIAEVVDGDKRIAEEDEYTNQPNKRTKLS